MKRKIAILLAVVMMLSSTAFAATPATRTVTAEKTVSVTIYIDSDFQIFVDENRQAVYPIIYNGTTYLPIRAIGGVMGKTVSWDSATKSIQLITPETPLTPVDSSGVQWGGSDEKISVTISPDITVYIDGVLQTFKDVNGQVVYPISYNGTTYLPIRAIAGIMGKKVIWDQESQRIFLGKRPFIVDWGGDAETDADGNLINSNSWAEPYTYAMGYMTALLNQLDDACDVIYSQGTSKDEMKEQYELFCEGYPVLDQMETVISEYDTNALTEKQKTAHDAVLKAVEKGRADYEIIKNDIDQAVNGSGDLSASKIIYDAHLSREYIKEARAAIENANIKN